MHNRKLFENAEKFGMNLARIPGRKNPTSLLSLNHLETGKFRWPKIREKY
jgi:hypothetical protein